MEEALRTVQSLFHFGRVGVTGHVSSMLLSPLHVPVSTQIKCIFSYGDSALTLILINFIFQETRKELEASVYQVTKLFNVNIIKIRGILLYAHMNLVNVRCMSQKLLSGHLLFIFKEGRVALFTYELVESGLIKS